MSERTEKFKWSFALPTVTALVLGGCAMVGSAPTFVEEPGVTVGCHSTLGSYSLPKAVLRIQITKKKTDPFHVLQSIDVARVPDNQHTFCLDYLRSPTSSDQIRVLKNKIKAEQTTPAATIEFKTIAELRTAQKRVVKSVSQETTPFLQLIASKAVDHTAGIIRRFIRAAFILLTNKGDFTSARSAFGSKFGTGDDLPIVVADFQIDPFDYREMARLNDAVRRYGFCFALEDYTFERSVYSADGYCRSPLKAASERPPFTAEVVQAMHYVVPKPVDGVYYRPRAAYRLSVYIKEDPNGRGVWRLGQLKNFQMENMMPILSVGVSRTIFATRRTGLVFDDGTLTNVCISKGSELEAAIEIPLDVVYGLIALPSETIRAAINDAATAKDLLVAQSRLVDAQNRYINFLNGSLKSTLTQPETAADKKPQSLVLGTSAGAAVNAIPDDSPDAGEIVSTDPKIVDALGEICAELNVIQTRDINRADGAVTEGKF